MKFLIKKLVVVEAEMGEWGWGWRVGVIELVGEEFSFLFSSYILRMLFCLYLFS